MAQDHGASSLREDRAGALRAEPAAQSQAKPLVPLRDDSAFLLRSIANAGPKHQRDALLKAADELVLLRARDAAWQLQAGEAEDDWQPIETAPRDGSYFLGGWWVNGGNRWMQTAIRFRTVRSIHTFQLAVTLCGTTKNPTHWRPLPEPPAQGIAARSDETPKAVRPEGQEPGGEAMRPDAVA